MVDRLEKSGAGLNLCFETRMGILNHTTGAHDDTAEATVVRMSDKIAYINHDSDDAIRAGILTGGEIPELVRKRMGERHSTRIDTIIKDIIENSADGEIKMSDDMVQAVDVFYDFLYEKVYSNQKAKGEETKVSNILGSIWEYYLKNPDKLPADYKRIASAEGVERAVCDYVSGMTDDYAVFKFSSIYIPAAWQVK